MLTRADFCEGRKFRVIKAGAKLQGMQPVRGGQQGWAQSLAVGTILTCAGKSMTFGDGVPIVKWTDENGKFLANDCEFKPSLGGMWSSYPNPEFLEAV